MDVRKIFFRREYKKGGTHGLCDLTSLSLPTSEDLRNAGPADCQPVLLHHLLRLLVRPLLRLLVRPLLRLLPVFSQSELGGDQEINPARVLR